MEGEIRQVQSCLFLTVFVILMGIYTLFHSFWIGLALTIIMPIAVRLLYEFLMMTVLLLKHVIMIDNKLKNQNAGDKKQGTANPEFINREPKNPAPAKTDPAKTSPASAIKTALKVPTKPQKRFCSDCGSPLDANGKCPNCNK